MIRSGLILMIREEEAKGKSGYAIGKKLDLSGVSAVILALGVNDIAHAASLF